MLLSRLLLSANVADAECWVIGGVNASQSPADYPNLFIWPWNPVTGFGTPLTSRVSAAGSDASEVSLSPDGKVILYPGLFADNYLHAFPFDATDGSYSSSLPVNNLRTLSLSAIKMSPALTSIYTGLNTSGNTYYNTSYAFLYDPLQPQLSGVGPQLQGNTVGPTASPRAVAFTPSGDAIAVSAGSSGSSASTQNIWLYGWNETDGPNGSYSLGGGYPIYYCNDLAWNPDGTILAASGNKVSATYAGVYTWKWDTSLSPAAYNRQVPSTLPLSSGYKLGWSPDGAYLVVGGVYITSGSGPVLCAYPIDPSDNSFGDPIYPPNTISFTRNITGVFFSPDGKYLFVSQGEPVNTVPWYENNPVVAFKWDPDSGGFGDIVSIADPLSDDSTNFVGTLAGVTRRLGP